MPARLRAPRRLLAVAVATVVGAGACAPAVPAPARPAGSAVTGDGAAARVVVDPRDPAPPVEPAALVGGGRDGLAILTPAEGARVTTRSLVVEGVAPSGARVVLDGPLFLDEAVSADAWGAWALPVTLGRGPHELVFTLDGRAASARTLRIEVAADAVDAAPAVVWPPDGATVGSAEVALRGSAAPGARVRISRDDTGGALERLLGIDQSVVADGGGRWAASVALAPGANRLLVTAGGSEVAHTLVHEHGAAPAQGLAPELELVSTHVLPVHHPENGAGVQVAVEVRNVSPGWLDLGGAAPPTARIGGVGGVGGARGAWLAVPLLPFPRHVAPGHTALLLGEATGADLAAALEGDPSAVLEPGVEVGVDADIRFAPRGTPAQRGRVVTWDLAAVPGRGLRVHGRFVTGSATAPFRVAVLGYDASGSLIGFAVSPSSAPSGPSALSANPGEYDACCLPLFGAAERARLARVVGLVTPAE